MAECFPVEDMKHAWVPNERTLRGGTLVERAIRSLEMDFGPRIRDIDQPGSLITWSLYRCNSCSLDAGVMHFPHGSD
jgi:hypothetical protein